MFTLLHLLMSAIAALVAAIADMISPAGVPEQAPAPQRVVYGISEPPGVDAPALHTGRGADARLTRLSAASAPAIFRAALDEPTPSTAAGGPANVLSRPMPAPVLAPARNLSNGAVISMVIIRRCSVPAPEAEAGPNTSAISDSIFTRG
jgi:hypothetical protein